MEWNPGKFFDDRQTETPYALLILNQPLNVRAYGQVAPHGMQQRGVETIALTLPASMIICVDGGANHLHKIFQVDKSPFDRVSLFRSRVIADTQYLYIVPQLPNAIVGDLDSLEDDVHDFFRDAGATQIVRVSEQDSTDFAKALRWLRKQGVSKLGDRIDVVALGGLGGRVDQCFSTIHHLFMAVSDPDLLNGDIYLLSEQSLSFVLQKGRNLIHGLAPGQSKKFRENVGIIPIRGPATVSTSGLEWDIRDWRTEFGGQVSTSNHIKADEVRIETSDRLLFTVELADTLCAL